MTLEESKKCGTSSLASITGRIVLQDMGQFTERVQSGAIPGPLRRSFTADRWKREFDSFGAPDEGDQRIYEAALVIHAKLTNIRSRLKLSSSSTLSATTKLRAFVAGANHNFLVARTTTTEALKKAGAERAKTGLKGVRLEQFAADVKLELKSGFECSPSEVVENLVDGIEVPIRNALNSDSSLAGNPRMNQVSWTDIALELNLGIMFRQAEELWDDCLWNSYKVVETVRGKFFFPQDFDVAQAFVVGQARHFSLAMSNRIMAAKYYRTLIARGLLPRVREVTSIAHQGKRQVLKIARADDCTKTQEDLFVMRDYANEPYYSELIEEAVPNFGGLNLSSVLDGWMVISRAALLLVDHTAKNAERFDLDSPAHSWLPEYAPVLQVDALVKALSSAVGFNLDESKRLVDFFTFRGKSGQELWASPLVPVGAKTVAPVFAAVVSPNLRRLVDVWMRQLDIDLGKRGPAFEAHLRDRVVHSISSSRVLAGHAACIKDGYTFRPQSGCKEDIDLLFVVGSTVFLGEAKCILEPTEPKGVAMHRKTVKGAAEQARRKAQVLVENRDVFVEDMKHFGIDLPREFTVVQFIVVSTATHVGILADGVPVVDQYILEKFLVGELEDVAVTCGDLQIQERIKTIFYTDLADAQAKAPRYFAHPPQVQRLLEGVTKRYVPVQAIDDQDWDGLMLTFACVPTHAGLST